METTREITIHIDDANHKVCGVGCKFLKDAEVFSSRMSLFCTAFLVKVERTDVDAATALRCIECERVFGE